MDQVGDAELAATYNLDVIQHLDRIAPQDWDRLVEHSSASNPFVRHAYFTALHESGSAVPAQGWSPNFLVVRDAHQHVVGACPAYVKSHSYGEYVFDWSWANAYQQHGLQYYPKLVVAVPFTPVTGPRLFAATPAVRELLKSALCRLAEDNHLSSVHILFAEDAERSSSSACHAGDWLERTSVQFHWANRSPGPLYSGFDDFLADMNRVKRKKIAQERRYVRDAGVSFTALFGDEIQEKHWDFFYECYRRTYLEHHSTPYLTRSFFEVISVLQPQNWLLMIAHRGGQQIAASLVAVDAGRRQAFGRYWGSLEKISCLHFEACYYQPIEWCIENRYLTFEGGAQGEHKMARGLLPQKTHSMHWIADQRFAAAIKDFLSQETSGVLSYVSDLDEHSPYRKSME